jgi:hypothetical protein
MQDMENNKAQISRRKIKVILRAALLFILFTFCHGGLVYVCMLQRPWNWFGIYFVTGWWFLTVVATIYCVILVCRIIDGTEALNDAVARYKLESRHIDEHANPDK